MDELKRFFFEAMLQGWTTGSFIKTLPGMPEYSKVMFSRDSLSLVDIWCTRPGSPWSAGTTTIFESGSPRWFMQYHGWYSEDGSTVCKAALLSAYQAGLFIGGRGPRTLWHPDLDLVYENEPTANGFGRFSGHEVVHAMSDPAAIHGEHWYSGGLMLNESEMPEAE